MKTRLFPFFKSSVRSSSVLAASITMMLGAHSASAATLYWDTDGTTSGFGTASGTWDTDAFWSTDATGASATAATVTTIADLINFGTGTVGLAAGPVAVSGTVSAGSITFGSASGAIALTGGTITLDPAATITVNNASDSISSILAGAATSLVKNGTGTLTLSGANTYTGATTLSAGTLSVATTDNLGAAASNLVFDGGTLQITGTALTSLSGIGHAVSFNATKTVGFDINNAANIFTADQVLNQTTGGLIKLGAGTLILNQANTHTGLNTLSAGTLVMGNTQALGTNVAGIAIAFSNTTAILDIATDGGDLAYRVSAGSGTIFTIASNVKTGSVGINHTLGTLSIGGSTTAGLTRLNIVAGGAVLSGTPSITLGNVTLSTGSTAGAISTFNPTTASLTLANVTTSGATTGTKVLNLDGTSTGNFVTGVISNGTSSLAVTKTNTSTWTLSGVNTFTGGTTITAGTIKLGIANALGANGASVAVSSGALLDLNGTNQQLKFTAGTGVGTVANNSGSGTSILTLTFNSPAGQAVIKDNNGIAGGTVAVVIAATGQNLDVTNSYTGGTTVNSGQFLYMATGAGAGTGAITLSASTSGLLGNVGATFANDITGAGYVSNNTNAAGTITLTGTLSNTGIYTFRNAGNIYNFAGNGTTSTLSGSIGTLGGTNGTSSAGNIIKSGTGTLTLSGVNIYTGLTTVSAGTLALSGARTATATGGFTVGNVNGSTGTLNLSNGTFSTGTVTLGSGNGTALGIINQTGGTLTLTGTQLIMGNGGAAAAAAGNGGNGTYNLSAGSLITSTSGNRGIMLGTNDAGTSTFNLSGTGILNASNAFLMVGRSDANALNTTNLFNQTGGTATVGTLTIGGAAAAATGLNSTFTATGGTFSTTSFTALGVGNSGVVTMNIGGTAVVTLPDFPTVHGTGTTTTINFDGGTLKNAAASATYMGGLTNAFIKVGGARFDTTNGSITITQNLLTDVTTGGGLTKIGTGTLTLSGANTYTGNTTVGSGTLSLTTPYLADTSAVSVASSATLNLDYVGTDIVASLDLGGTVKTTGTFDSTNSGGLITGTGKIQVGGSAANYASWATAHGITGQPPSGDFDKDGLSNLVEYALGLEPTQANGSAGTFIGNVQSFTKGNEAFANGDLTYEIESSTTLETWSVVVANNPAQSTITYTLPTGLPKQFARLKVTQIP